MKRKRKRIVVMVGVFGLLIAAMGWRIVTLNIKYPNPQVITYQQNEPIKGGEIEMVVTDSKIVSMQDIKELLPEIEDPIKDKDGNLLEDDQKKVLLVELEIQNLSDAKQKTTVTPFTAQSRAWSNGMDMNTYLGLNRLQTTGIELGAKEKQIIIMPFVMYDFQFKKDEFSSIEQRDFQLVLSTYPIKNLVELRSQN